MDPVSLGKARHEISAALPDQAIRITNGRGGVAVRDRTVTGFKSLLFPPLESDVFSATADQVGYRFNLAFREQESGVLIQDVQDEMVDPLYLNTLPNIHKRLGAMWDPVDYANGIGTLTLVTQDALWQPDAYIRTGAFHKYVNGRLISFGLRSTLSVSALANEVYLALEIENRTDRPLCLTLIPDQHKELGPRDACFEFDGGNFKVRAVCDLGEPGAEGWGIEIPARAKRSAVFGLLINSTTTVSDLPRRAANSRHAMRDRLAWAAERLPKVETANKQFDELYRRAILSVLLCRFDNPEFIAQPFYDLGWGRGTSTVWDLSFTSRLIAALDPDGLKTMIRTHARYGILKSTWLSCTGQPFGWYIQQPFAMQKILTDYITQTGDAGILNCSEGGATLVEQLRQVGDELVTRYLRDDGLLDCGEATHAFLEIRTSGYARVVAAVNGLAADYFAWLGALTGEHRYRELAQRIAGVLPALWNESAGWYENIGPGADRHLVFSYHQFDLLECEAAPLVCRQRLTEQLRDGVFLGPYGIFSIARTDLQHWDREDYDWGGGGQYVGMPGRIVESLYRLGKPELAWDLLARCARWVERFPYFPQTVGADELGIAPHQGRWPLQISSGALAQAILFGVFGLRPAADGSITFQPAYHPSLGEAKLTGYAFRGHVYDVTLKPAGCEVYRDGRKL